MLSEINTPMSEENYSERQTESLKLWIELIRSSNSFVSEMDANFRMFYGQNLSRFDVLSQLNRCEHLTVGQLASRLIASKGNITGLLNRMNKDGLVKKTANNSDKRSFNVSLTLQGKTLFKQMAKSHAQWTESFFKSQSIKDMNEITSFLSEVRLSHSNNKVELNESEIV